MDTGGTLVSKNSFISLFIASPCMWRCNETKKDGFAIYHNEKIFFYQRHSTVPNYVVDLQVDDIDDIPLFSNLNIVPVKLH